MRCQHNIQNPAFSAENIQVVQVTRGKNYTNHFRNGRPSNGFLYVEKGSVCCEFPDFSCKNIHLNAEELMFIPKLTIYSSRYLEDDTEIKIVQFDLFEGHLPDYMHVPVKLALPNAKEWINAFWTPLQHSGFDHPFYSLSCFYRLMWQLEISHTGVSTKYKKLQPALSALSADHTQNHPVCYYSALCGMSEPNFRRLFREYTGQSPIDYRNALRLNAAQIKLQSGEYNVSEAAETSGFSNLSFFIRLYKKRYGYTPKKE